MMFLISKYHLKHVVEVVFQPSCSPLQVSALDNALRMATKLQAAKSIVWFLEESCSYFYAAPKDWTPGEILAGHFQEHVWHRGLWGVSVEALDGDCLAPGEIPFRQT
eukprot:116386-Amphidinium_carterae.1